MATAASAAVTGSNRRPPQALLLGGYRCEIGCSDDSGATGVRCPPSSVAGGGSEAAALQRRWVAGEGHGDGRPLSLMEGEGLWGGRIRPSPFPAVGGGSGLPDMAALLSGRPVIFVVFLLELWRRMMFIFRFARVVAHGLTRHYSGF